MADDVATPSNPQVSLVEKEELEEAELEEAPLDMNVFQWSCKEEPSRKVTRTRINRSA